MALVYLFYKGAKYALYLSNNWGVILWLASFEVPCQLHNSEELTGCQNVHHFR